MILTDYYDVDPSPPVTHHSSQKSCTHFCFLSADRAIQHYPDTGLFASGSCSCQSLCLGSGRPKSTGLTKCINFRLCESATAQRLAARCCCLSFSMTYMQETVARGWTEQSTEQTITACPRLYCRRTHPLSRSIWSVCSPYSGGAPPLLIGVFDIMGAGRASPVPPTSNCKQNRLFHH